MAVATKRYVEASYNDVRSELEWSYLPAAILAIWGESPLSAPDRKASKSSQLEGLRDICQIIATFPGSTAVRKIHEVLVRTDAMPDSHNEKAMAEEFFNLTIYYMRVQNFARHMKTSVNNHLRALGIDPRSESKFSTYETALFEMEQIGKLATALKKQMLDDADEVNTWADNVAALLASTNENERTRRAQTSGDYSSMQAGVRTRGLVASGGLVSYKLRFKQAIAATLGINLNLPDTKLERTITKSISDQMKALGELPKSTLQLYKKLGELQPQRLSKLTHNLGSFSWELKTDRNENPKKNLHKHVLQLDGRNLIIEGSSQAYTAELIDGIMKTVSIQMELNPNARELLATFESKDQLIRITLEKPRKTDQRKIAQVLAQLAK